MGRRSNCSSIQYTPWVTHTEAHPTTAPRATYTTSALISGDGTSGMGNTGSGPPKASRTAVAVTAASATGINDAGRYSKSSSSTARSTEETGEPNVAAMPAAAP